jgi:hypothetical protein
MFHLVEDTFGRIESNLIYSGKVRDSWFSFWFNISLLCIVLSSFVFFLYSSYGTEQKRESIEFKPQTWLNAVRNVPGDQDYGQVPQTEIRGGIQGIAYRTSTATI